MTVPSGGGGGGGRWGQNPPQGFDKVTITLLQVPSLPPKIRETLSALPPYSKNSRYGADIIMFLIVTLYG